MMLELKCAHSSVVFQWHGLRTMIEHFNLCLHVQVIQRSTHPSRREARSAGKKFPIGHSGGELEGSLLHCLYLQLLAAGSKGMTLKEIFASFASQTEFSRLYCD